MVDIGIFKIPDNLIIWLALLLGVLAAGFHAHFIYQAWSTDWTVNLGNIILAYNDFGEGIAEFYFLMPFWLVITVYGTYLFFRKYI